MLTPLTIIAVTAIVKALNQTNEVKMKPATRVPVSIDADERAEIEAAMKRHGIRAMADYLRFAALFVAKRTEQ